MLKIKHLTVLLLTVSSGFSVAFSQNNTNSPYTRFGFGDVSDNTNGSQRAMGGIGAGYRSSRTINTMNPAAYTAVDSLTFMFDVGASGIFSRFSNASGSNNKWNGNLEYITMQFPVAKSVAISAGLLPYSFSGYDFYETRSIKPDPSLPNDSVTATTSYYGNGAISQVYLGAAVKLFQHFSLGANIYYMFGNVSNTRAVSYNKTSMATTGQSNTINVNDIRFRYGLQYFNTFAEKHDYSIGAFYENKSKLNSSFTQITTLPDTVTSTDFFDLPQNFGVGAFYTYDKRLSIGADFSLQQWKNAIFFGVTDSLRNRSKFSLGAEYMQNPNGAKYAHYIRYRVGLSLATSYYNVGGTSMPPNLSLSLGIGLPVPRSNTLINASIEYSKIGNKSEMSEDFFKFTLSATINETWFMKRKL